MTRSCLKKEDSARSILSETSSCSDSTTITSSSRRSCRTSRVAWGDLHIHEFPLILGDNPAVSSGAPLSIDWQAINSKTIRLDRFEHLRANVCPRRRRNEMRLSKDERDSYLLSVGYSVDDVIDASMETSRIRLSREHNKKSDWRDCILPRSRKA